jgi:aspartate/methionine/tyrosine aminotransferase
MVFVVRTGGNPWALAEPFAKSFARWTLAATRICGVPAYSIGERTREIGVRVALGARPGRIAALVLGAGALLEPTEALRRE